MYFVLVGEDSQAKCADLCSVICMHGVQRVFMFHNKKPGLDVYEMLNPVLITRNMDVTLKICNCLLGSSLMFVMM